MHQVQESGEISLDDLNLLIRKTGSEMRRFVKSLSAQPADTLFQNLRTTVEKIGSSPVRRPRHSKGICSSGATSDREQ